MRVAFWFFLLVAIAGADEAQQVQMLKEAFGQPRVAWESILANHRVLLNRPFFQNVAERLLWDLNEGQFEDAIRFATVGDLALRVLGKPPRFSRKVAVAFGASSSSFSGLDPELVKAGQSGDFFAQPRPVPKPFPRAAEVDAALVGIDLSQEGDWKLVIPKKVVYRLGETLRTIPYQLGDHTDWTSSPLDLDEQGLWTSGGVRPESFLQQGERDFFLDGIWVGSLRVSWSGLEVARRRPSSTAMVNWWPVCKTLPWGWKARLGSPDCRFQDLECQSEVDLYRSPLADIGLEVTGREVTGVILMEPGQLRVNLQRLSRFREI